MKKAVFFIIFLLSTLVVFGQEFINNIENNYFRSMGNLGRELPGGLHRKSYFLYNSTLISYSANGNILMTGIEEFETNGEIVVRYSIIFTWDNIIPEYIKLFYIEFFDAFFGGLRLNPANFVKNAEDNSRYVNGSIQVDDAMLPIVIKIFELENAYSSQQIIEVSLR